MGLTRVTGPRDGGPPCARVLRRLVESDMGSFAVLEVGVLRFIAAFADPLVTLLLSLFFFFGAMAGVPVEVISSISSSSSVALRFLPESDEEAQVTGLGAGMSMEEVGTAGSELTGVGKGNILSGCCTKME